MLIAAAFGAACFPCSCLYVGLCPSLREEAIFSGRVTRVVPGEWSSVYTLSILEAFRGVATDSIDVETGNSTASCGMPLRLGEEYLIFARRYKPGGNLRAGFCGGGTGLRGAAHEVALLRHRKRHEHTSSGHVLGSALHGVNEWPRHPRFPIVGAPVSATAENGSVDLTVTASDGSFQFYDLPAGTYRISIGGTGEYLSRELRVQVEPDACTDAVFRERTLPIK
jgi:hypothetical protein